jgi:hypothetical protein
VNPKKLGKDNIQLPWPNVQTVMLAVDDENKCVRSITCCIPML